MSISRGKTLDTGRYGIEASSLPGYDPDEPHACRVDPRAWFDDPQRPLELEIGCGKGTFLVQQAEIDPDINYLGIETAADYYRFAADRVRRRGLEHVRILHGDATDFLRYKCPDAIFAVIHLYFSDPWPKKRHHKRRVVQATTMHAFHRVLAPGGQLRLVTDHEGLWTWYQQHAEQHAALFQRTSFAPPPSAHDGELVGTNYERKFSREGRPLHAMTLVRAEG